MRTFRYVQETERRFLGTENKRALELIRSAYAALEQTLHTPSRARKSSLYLAARMAVGLSLRELTRGDEVPSAA